MTHSKIVILITLLVLGSLIVFFVVRYYGGNKNRELTIKQANDLVQECKNLQLSEELFSIIEKLNKYYPSISVSGQNIQLSFPSAKEMWVSEAGVGLMFDKEYKLTNKACNSDWEPEVKSFKELKN